MQRSPGSKVRNSHPQSVALALAAIGCALALTACGSSHKPSDAAASANKQALAYADCMRSHGVPNFPDPGAGGQFSLSPGSGINPQSPAFQSAQQSCAKLQPGPGTGAPPMTASQRRLALSFAECMRRHGLPTFPDPKSSSSTAPTPTLDLRGLQFPIGPGLNPQSPAFKQAAKACGLKIP